MLSRPHFSLPRRISKLIALTSITVKTVQYMVGVMVKTVRYADYLESTSRVRAFIPRVSSRPFGISLPRTYWVRLNRLRTGVGRFHSSMCKWGLVPSPNCECGTTEQTADHVISLCLIHHVPRGTRGLQVLDDATRCWLNTTTTSI